MLRVEVVPWSMTRMCRDMAGSPGFFWRHSARGLILRMAPFCAWPYSAWRHFAHGRSFAHSLVDGVYRGGRQAQAQLGPPPDDVCRGARPLMIHEVAKLRLRQAGAEVLAEIGSTARVAQQDTDTGAVGAAQAVHGFRGQEAVARGRGGDETLEAVDGKIAAGQGGLRCPAGRRARRR